MQLTVVGWLVFDMTHSPAWLGVVGAARAFPMIALPFFGGVIADRMDRRTLLWMTQSSQALVSIVLTPSEPKLDPNGGLTHLINPLAKRSCLL